MRVVIQYHIMIQRSNLSNLFHNSADRGTYSRLSGQCICTIISIVCVYIHVDVLACSCSKTDFLTLLWKAYTCHLYISV